MSLQFIIGSSGSGKTRYLYENLISMSMDRPQEQFIAIVPEQFTMQTQKEIVKLHPNHGTMNIDIVSFQRLAYRVFEELGVENLEVLDDMGKSMVLRRVASEQKKNLGLYAGHLNQTGFINKLKSMLSELYQYGIRPENLLEAQKTASPLLREKLKDFSVIYQAFQEAIADRFITAEEILDVPGAAPVRADQEQCHHTGRIYGIYTGAVPAFGIDDGACQEGDRHHFHGSGGRALQAGQHGASVPYEQRDGSASSDAGRQEWSEQGSGYHPEKRQTF